jgi:hypothetical protein
MTEIANKAAIVEDKLYFLAPVAPATDSSQIAHPFAICCEIHASPLVFTAIVFAYATVAPATLLVLATHLEGSIIARLFTNAGLISLPPTRRY